VGKYDSAANEALKKSRLLLNFSFSTSPSQPRYSIFDIRYSIFDIRYYVLDLTEIQTTADVVFNPFLVSTSVSFVGPDVSSRDLFVSKTEETRSPIIPVTRFSF
jgi:hypothetical protein